eukprot:1469555-Prymnesium_polylepis.1
MPKWCHRCGDTSTITRRMRPAARRAFADRASGGRPPLRFASGCSSGPLLAAALLAAALLSSRGARQHRRA